MSASYSQQRSTLTLSLGHFTIESPESKERAMIAMIENSYFGIFSSGTFTVFPFKNNGIFMYVLEVLKGIENSFQ